ncbi:hypothetical protein O1611_g9624 [Lasiodiplodia mahajangana]|uniref:Uncharacterized protein n=1 Tax=Lasiodiplodia mahajangana TaxID=1108764 RepID=A0ACC2J793_9PEZI|nr:hypothetical protein O1611_g9624 [Lasiodiplodia mahajangana]
MHLIYAGTDEKYDRYEIQEFLGDSIPKYAILSHTWGEDEVTFKDMQHLDERVKAKQGFKKIAGTCDQALRDGLSWAWVDTCCIDKSSSADLSEAINSMYAWYGNATRCYAYLVDVPTGDDPFAEQSAFRKSRWFTRAWTLQELVAPTDVVFYDNGWQIIGVKWDFMSPYLPEHQHGPGTRFAELLEEVTEIPDRCLMKYTSPHSYSVAKRMSWASKRDCTRVEDSAYSLMGLFGVNMPLLYGEGTKAFVRLQEEIMKEIDDHSLFAWTLPDKDNQDMMRSILAQSPAAFAWSGNIIPVQQEEELSFMTRKGLRIRIGMRPAEIMDLTLKPNMPRAVYGILNCAPSYDTNRRIALLLIPEISQRGGQYLTFYRCATRRHSMFTTGGMEKLETIYVSKCLQLDLDAYDKSWFFPKQHLTVYPGSLLGESIDIFSILASLKRLDEVNILHLPFIGSGITIVSSPWDRRAEVWLDERRVAEVWESGCVQYKDLDA